MTRAFVSFARARALSSEVSLARPPTTEVSLSLARTRVRERDLGRRWARERVFERVVSIDRSRDGKGAREGPGTMGAMARMWVVFPR